MVENLVSVVGGYMGHCYLTLQEALKEGDAKKEMGQILSEGQVDNLYRLMIDPSVLREQLRHCETWKQLSFIAQSLMDLGKKLDEEATGERHAQYHVLEDIGFLVGELGRSLYGIYSLSDVLWEDDWYEIREYLVDAL